MPTYPDTRQLSANRIRERILRDADSLARQAGQADDDTRRRHLQAAERGARTYAAFLRQALDEDVVTWLMQEEAELVAAAARCEGWLMTTGAVLGCEAEMTRLMNAGYFVLDPNGAGVNQACYRLVGPA